MLLPRFQSQTDFSSLVSDETWSFRDVTRAETSYISHSYHRYPAKFIPQLVKRLIVAYTKPGALVFDPFGGCGTTLVEAKVLGRKSIGYDINPVAKLITEAKITAIRPALLDKYHNKFLSVYSQKVHLSDNIIHSDRINYWFDSSTQIQLDRIFSSINLIQNYKIKKFYLCAFSHVLKNCSRWLMKSIKPQVDPSKVPPNAYEAFLIHIHHMMAKNRDFFDVLEQTGNVKTQAVMRLRDSTKRFPLTDNSIDLIITSPPYVTSYEYADLHQLILLWLGDDKKRYSRWNKYAQEYQAFRGKFVGTKLAAYAKDFETLGSTAHNIIRQLPNNRKYAKSVAKYFSDTQKSFVEMYRVLKPGSKACIIIGNTTLLGIEIKNAEVTAEQMQKAGFKIINVIKRELSNKMITSWRDKVNGRFTNTASSQKMRVYEYEFVIIGEKPGKLPN